MMLAHEVIEQPVVQRRLRRNLPRRRQALAKLAHLLRWRTRALCVYEAFGAHDVVAVDLYPRLDHEDDH